MRGMGVEKLHACHPGLSQIAPMTAAPQPSSIATGRFSRRFSAWTPGMVRVLGTGRPGGLPFRPNPREIPIMKKILSALVAIAFVAVSVPAFAEEGTKAAAPGADAPAATQQSKSKDSKKKSKKKTAAKTDPAAAPAK